MNANRPLTWKQQNMVDQVTATMSIENITITQEETQMLKDLATDRKTINQVIGELNRRNWNE